MPELRLPRRRTGLRRSFVLLMAMVVALPIALLVTRAGDEEWRTATTVTGLGERGVVYLSEEQVFVIHTEDGPLALSARSPRFGNRAVFCSFSETFTEVHGSKWDRLGRYLDGPAPRGLDRVATRINGRLVEVNPTRIERGPGREVHGTPPSGGFCEVPGPEDPPGFAANPIGPS